MKGFATADYIIVIAYLCTIAAIGSSFYRRKSTPKEYFLGGRSMSWLPVGISIIAADLSAITVMGTPAWAYKYNLEPLWITATYPLVAPLVILIFIPFYTRLNLYTAYEYLEKRFDLKVRLVISFLFQLLRGVHVAVAIYGPSLVINLVTGLPLWECIIFMGLFTTVYTTFGGMRAVIWTDVIQFCTVTCGVLLIFAAAINNVPGGVESVYKVASESGHLKLFDFTWNLNDLTSFWACLIGGSVLSLSAMTTDQAILQRLFTTKSAKDCRQAVILQSVLVIPITLLLLFAGTALYAFYRYHPNNLVGLSNSDAIMPFFAVRELPVGASGLIIAAIFAASMAVMSAGINSLTTATTIDFYQRIFRPDKSQEHYATVGRVGTGVWGLTLTLLALLAKHLGDLLMAYNRVSSVISGPVLGVFLLGVTTRRTTASGSLIGVAAGFGVVILVMTNTTWSFLYRGAIGVLTTFAVGYCSSLFMLPPPLENIRDLVMGKVRVRAVAVADNT